MKDGMWLLICVLFGVGSALAQSGVVEQVCPGTGSTCGGLSTLQARGFQSSLPWDAANQGFLYWAGTTSNTGIYSNAVFFYNPATKTFVKKVDNGATATAYCGQTGAPEDTAEPLNGHPEGTFWTSGTHAFMTGQLCGGQRPGFTNRYVLSTETMTTRLAVGPFATGDGTHNGGGQSFQQIRYAPNVEKAFYCCYSGSGATPKVVEFNGSTYTDVTASLTGGTIPGPLTGHGMVYLGGLLYVYGGCSGTSPGNNGDCATPHTGIFSINPSTYAVTLLSPSGTAPSSTYSSFPLIAADTARNRILVWDGTNLKAYSVSGNSWSNVTLSGDTPIVLPTGSGGSGNMAGYDPVRDIMVMIVSRGQSFTPQVQNITFGNGAALDIDITISEALYPGSTSGVARTDEPFTVGIPLPDSAAITNTNTLALAGATAGQFRCLGSWPSGNCKWVQVSGIEDSLSAGATSTVTLANDGSGNFGGSNLATDNGDGTITVSTNGGTCGAGSAICFDIKKANFNVLNRVRIGGTEILATSTAETRGFVVTGPAAGGTYPANVTCSPESGGATCNVVFSSANDASSTVTIEQNGPVMAVLKATGSHKDSSGNTYMKFTARLYFYKGKSYVKVNSILRNADYGTSGTFATAYKGFDGYELRLDPGISGTLSWTIANETATPASGTMSGSDNLYVYQGASDSLKWQDWCGFQCVAYSTDSGWRLNVNGSDTDSGSASQVIGGWGNIENSSGVGIQIGVYQMSAYWPKSLEFLSGGDDVRVGIWSARNTSNHYQSWPEHSIHDVFLNFHASMLSAANARDAFLKLQHYLVGRAAVDHYNESGALLTQLTTSTAEDAYMAAAASNASPPLNPNSARPILDYGTQFPTWPLSIYRWYAHGAGSGANQDEFRWGDMIQFFKRGFTGRLLNSSHFYRHQAEQTYPHSDGFQWQDHPGQYDGFTQPTATSASSARAHRNWHDQEHHHWWGMLDYYFMTGDETIKDAILDGPADYFTNPSPLIYPSGLPGGRSGTVNTSGTAVTSASGNTFTQAMVGSSIKIGSAIYRITSYTDSTHITLATSAGSQTGAQWYQGGGLFNTRSIGGHLTSAAVLSRFLDAVGETSSATAVRTQSDQLFKMQVDGNVCMNGHPSNCAVGTIDGGPWSMQGVNRKRGAHWGASGTSGSWCGASHAYRVNSSFQTSIMIRGLIEYSTLRGTGWAEYWNARDLAYGLSQFAIGYGGTSGELFVDDGSGSYTNNGFRFGIAFDRENNCSGGGESPEENFPAISFGQQTVWNVFWAQHLTNGGKPWETKFKIGLQKLTSVSGLGTSDFGGIGINNIIGIANDPGTATLQSLTITDLDDNGDNTYDLSVTVPAGCQFYRVKYSPLAIVDWIGFDPGTNTFIGNPTTTENWFAATNASSIPLCATPGATQVITVNAGAAGLTASNFSIKAMTDTSIVPGGVARMSGGSRVSGASRTGQ